MSSMGDLPDPEIEPESPALASRFFTTESDQAGAQQLVGQIMVSEDSRAIVLFQCHSLEDSVAWRGKMTCLRSQPN